MPSIIFQNQRNFFHRFFDWLVEFIRHAKWLSSDFFLIVQPLEFGNNLKINIQHTHKHTPGSWIRFRLCLRSHLVDSNDQLEDVIWNNSIYRDHSMFVVVNWIVEVEGIQRFIMDYMNRVKRNNFRTWQLIICTKVMNFFSDLIRWYAYKI